MWTFYSHCISSDGEWQHHWSASVISSGITVLEKRFTLQICKIWLTVNIIVHKQQECLLHVTDNCQNRRPQKRLLAPWDGMRGLLSVMRWQINSDYINSTVGVISSNYIQEAKREGGFYFSSQSTIWDLGDLHWNPFGWFQPYEHSSSCSPIFIWLYVF